MANISISNGAKSQPFTIIVEGNVSSGKSTFLNYFQKSPDLCLLSEPLQEWRNVNGGNLLELTYSSPERWAMPFQSYVMLTQLKNHMLQTDKSIKMIERSFLSGKKCFIEINFKENIHKNEVKYQILQEWYDFLEKNIQIRIDLIVYLRTTPEIVYERMRKRKRSEEDFVSMAYVREMHDQHEKWLMHNRSDSDIKVYVLDADTDLEIIVDEYKRFEESIIEPILQQRRQEQQTKAVATFNKKRKNFSK